MKNYLDESGVKFPENDKRPAERRIEFNINS